jgi:hypothetical protein
LRQGLNRDSHHFHRNSQIPDTIVPVCRAGCKNIMDLAGIFLPEMELISDALVKALQTPDMEETKPVSIGELVRRVHLEDRCTDVAGRIVGVIVRS